MTSTRRKTRADKVAEGTKQIIKEKFLEERSAKIVEIQPKTKNQEKALEYLKKRQVVVLRNASGTGKTFLACTHAANELLRGNCKRIVLIRPYEMVGRSIGLRPGDAKQKLLPLMQSMLQHLERVFGKNDLELKIETGIVTLECLEDVRGRSYADSIIIVDEAMNVDSHGMQALITRLEESSRMYICGDNAQRDTKTKSGMDELCNIIQKVRTEKPSYLNENDLHCAMNNFGVVNFTVDDVVRSGMTSLMVKVIDHDWK